MRRLKLTYVTAATFALGLGSAITLTGCIERSGGTWRFAEAKTVDDWPDLTVPGQVEIKRYPGYRAASVDEGSGVDARMRPMFNELFSHIKTNDIAMTTPVDITYEQRPSGEHDMTSMAFLYRTPELGPEGRDGAVRVHDVESRTYAVTSLRGGYNEQNYERGLDAIAAWMSEQSEWTQSGPPRYMGYNSPFVPDFFKYAEVLVPVRRVDTDE